MKKKIKSLKISVLCLSLLSAATVFSAGRKMAPPTVTVEKIPFKNFVVKREYVGRVESAESVNIEARVEGEIKKIYFKEGSLVKKGQKLIALEDVKYKANVMASKAKVAQCKATLEYAILDLKRKQKLVKSSAVAKKSYEEALRDKNMAKAQLMEAEANLIKSENELSYTKIYAPISGRIGKLSYTFGNIVSSQSGTLAKIVSVNPVRVNFSISERDFLNIFGTPKEFKENATVQIKLSNNKIYPVTGIPEFIDNEIQPRTGTLKLWVMFANDKMVLTPGGYVSVNVAKKDKNKKAVVKTSSLLTDAKGNFIYVVDTKNNPVKKYIKISGIVNNTAFIDGDLAENDRVITQGVHKVIPKLKVKPIAN